jgi:rubrerythrin
MSTLAGSKTHENLKRAFSTEAQANRRYLYFARQADVDGETNVASLFRDTAEGEAGHALGILDFLKEVGDPVTDLPIGDTLHNLQSAIKAETEEYLTIYSEFASTARAEGFEEIADWFDTLVRAEKSHANRFQRALESFQR